MACEKMKIIQVDNYVLDVVFQAVRVENGSYQTVMPYWLEQPFLCTICPWFFKFTWRNHGYDAIYEPHWKRISAL